MKSSDKDSKFIKQFETEVKNTISKYQLANKKEKILVACSGGKDSTTVLYILQKLGYHIEAISIDMLIGEYSKENINNIKKFCKEKGIKLTILSFREIFGYSLCYITSALKEKGSKLESCTICGILRRYILNKEARTLKSTKVVTGHNLDDEAQTIFMNLIRGNPSLNAKLGPITGTIKDKKFIPRIKPLYFHTEKDVEKYSKLMNFPVKYGKCPCSVNVFRRAIRNEFEKITNIEQIKENIVKNFLNTRKELRAKFKTDEKINYCEKCKEPSKGKECNACNIINLLKKSTDQTSN